jgi:hypothetical protein
MKFRSMISQVGKPVSTAEALTGRSTRWIAKKFGVSIRTAQRWKAGTQQPTEKGGRRAKVAKSADRLKVAAKVLRETRAVNAGRVGVKSDTGRAAAREGTRNVGLVHLDDSARDRMAQAADALAAGDVERAEDLVSDAILNTGGRNYGPLQISDYPPGFHLI